MRTLIFSDIHDNLFSLERLLARQTELDVQRLVCLGDVGHHPALFDLLAEAGAVCLFGNWEVSGLRRMAPDLAARVGAWPLRLNQGQAIFCHATPDADPAWTTTQSTLAAMQAEGLGWHRVFPRLHQDEEARWAAFAALEMADARVAFHGHTHVQRAWAWAPDALGRRQIRPILPARHPEEDVTEICLDPGTPEAPARYIVGVGSIGAPDDGPWPRFAVYDDEAQVVLLGRMER